MLFFFCPLCNFNCFIASCWLLLHIIFLLLLRVIVIFFVRYMLLVLFLHTSVIFLCQCCATHWCYYVVLCQWCFALVMLLLFRTSVANASCWWCCLTLVLLMLFHTNASQWWCCFYFALMVVLHISGVASTLCQCYWCL